MQSPVEGNRLLGSSPVDSASPPSTSKTAQPTASSSLKALFVCFGLSSWIAVNGAFAESPVFADRVPEGYNIANTMAVVLQFSNLVPLALATMRACGRGFDQNRHLSTMIWALLGLGVVCCVLMSAVWSVFAGDHSVGLLSIMFLLGVVDCTTTITYWPFARSFRENVVPALATGEAVTGLLMAVVAAIQTLGSDSARFGPSVFFLIVAAITAISACAFWMLRGRESHGAAGSSEEAEPSSPTTPAPSLSKLAHANALYLAVLLVANFLQNGVFVSILPFACLPYSKTTYEIATYLSLVSSTAGCWISERVHDTHLAVPGIASSVSILYLLIVSAGQVPLQSSTAAGGSLVVVFACGAHGCLSWLKTVAFMRMNRADASHAEESAKYLIGGYATQLGSCVGAVLTYLLIEYSDVFVVQY